MLSTVKDGVEEGGWCVDGDGECGMSRVQPSAMHDNETSTWLSLPGPRILNPHPNTPIHHPKSSRQAPHNGQGKIGRSTQAGLHPNGFRVPTAYK